MQSGQGAPPRWPRMASFPRAPLAACIAVGAGLGATLDIAVFHMVLQWHHLASERPGLAADLPANLRLDGLTLAAAWAVTVLGLAALLRHAARHPVAPSRVAGGALLGWALFNIADQLVNHLLLGLHHVHPSKGLGHELATAAWSLGMLVLGLQLVRRRSPRTD